MEVSVSYPYRFPPSEPFTPETFYITNSPDKIHKAKVIFSKFKNIN
jgi:hypothetical protein